MIFNIIFAFSAFAGMTEGASLGKRGVYRRPARRPIRRECQPNIKQCFNRAFDYEERRMCLRLADLTTQFNRISCKTVNPRKPNDFWKTSWKLKLPNFMFFYHHFNLFVPNKFTPILSNSQYYKLKSALSWKYENFRQLDFTLYWKAILC